MKMNELINNQMRDAPLHTYFGLKDWHEFCGAALESVGSDTRGEWEEGEEGERRAHESQHRFLQRMCAAGRKGKGEPKGDWKGEGAVTAATR